MQKLSIAYIASLIGDPARSAMLIGLLDGRALTAGELARLADISPQTASSHLHKLVEGKLIAVESQGRHRYFRLANADIAQVLETLAMIAPASQEAVASVKSMQEIHYARSCYDHLAGKLGVLINQALIQHNYIKHDGQNYKITSQGKDYFLRLDIDIDELHNKRRRLAYPCLDWSERLHHVAGALGQALLTYFIEHRWLMRAKKGRVLHLTAKGRIKLGDIFHLEL